TKVITIAVAQLGSDRHRGTPTDLNCTSEKKSPRRVWSRWASPTERFESCPVKWRAGEDESGNRCEPTWARSGILYGAPLHSVRRFGAPGEIRTHGLCFWRAARVTRALQPDQCNKIGTCNFGSIFETECSARHHATEITEATVHTRAEFAVQLPF